ncbi:MAG: hypothetical protein ACREAM_14570 [Blastocatellia bacterium]
MAYEIWHIGFRKRLCKSPEPRAVSELLAPGLQPTIEWKLGVLISRKQFKRLPPSGGGAAARHAAMKEIGGDEKVMPSDPAAQR